MRAQLATNLSVLHGAVAAAQSQLGALLHESERHARFTAGWCALLGDGGALVRRQRAAAMADDDNDDDNDADD